MNKALLITAFAIVVSSAYAHEPRKPVTNILRIDNEGARAILPCWYIMYRGTQANASYTSIN